MKTLSTIEAVRKSRHLISERVNHDPASLVKYYMDLQRKEVERKIIINTDRISSFTTKRKANHLDVGI